MTGNDSVCGTYINYISEADIGVMKNNKTIKLKSINEIPLGHKIALQDLKEGDAILKYGHDIGKVVKAIKKGEHVHVHNVKTKKW